MNYTSEIGKMLKEMGFIEQGLAIVYKDNVKYSLFSSYTTCYIDRTLYATYKNEVLYNKLCKDLRLLKLKKIMGNINGG